MDENLELDLDQDITREQKRLQNLSSKVAETSKERDEAKAALEEAKKAAETATKERDFYASFSQSIAKYPGATEYQDKIKEKVMNGYTVEDATVAVLNSEGKLQPQAAAPAPEAPAEAAQPAAPAPAAGGSAATAIPSGGATKSPTEMSLEEKRAALLEAEQRGDLSLN